MNYSASDAYHSNIDSFEKKRIKKENIRKRLFRNFYVLHQSKGYFTHNVFVFEAGAPDPYDADRILDKNNKYNGAFYGPFYEKETALSFGRRLVDVHLDFILG